MKEQLQYVWLLSRRELRDQLRDWRILTPLLILTIGFPFLMNLVAYYAVDLTNQYGGDLIVDRLVPFSILTIGFFPITISLLGALESFVGEKERGTIEPLLSLPLADWQLYLGKLTVGIVSPLISSFTSTGIYLFMVTRQGLDMPDPLVFVQLFLLTIAHALLMISAAIVISVQSTSVKAANLLASFVIIPITMLMMGETALFIRLDNQVLWCAVLAVIIMAGLLVRLGLAHFQREYLLGRDIDVLNLRWMWKTFWEYFRGGAQNVGGWFSVSLKTTFAKLTRPIAVLLVIAAASVWVGYAASQVYLPQYYSATGMETERLDALRARLSENGNLENISGSITAAGLFAHNFRSTFAIVFMGLFSFGVLGLVLYVINIGQIGVIIALFQLAGYPPGPLLLAGVAPHGIFEIPALIISCAAVLHIGLTLVTPQAHRTLGEVMLEALADWLKVTLAIVAPLLAVAAVIEAYITPQLLCSALEIVCK
ncbi:MAG: hypothetical protein HFACDABA_01886 [Anaerolineales bacterium]|nr:hypothetical protein [Anaerolineales bacterium]